MKKIQKTLHDVKKIFTFARNLFQKCEKIWLIT
jgi:hypothetical protein